MPTPTLSDKMFTDSVLVNKNDHSIMQQIVASNSYHKRNQSHFENVFVESSYREDRISCEERLESVWFARILSFLYVPSLSLENKRLDKYVIVSFDA